MNARATFTHMQDSTVADRQVISGEFMQFSKGLPDRVLAHLKIPMAQPRNTIYKAARAESI